MRERKLRIGVAGLGRAFTVMLPTFVADPRVALVAAADPRPEARARFAADFSAQSLRDRRGALRRSGGRDRLCGDAAPASRRARDPRGAARQACAGRKADGADARGLRRDDRGGETRASVHLIVGHSHSFDAPILRTRELIASGDFGAVRMIHALNYTDFLCRPRRPEELDTAQGGGAMFNQAAHQVDIVRLLGGGRVKSVRAATGAWDAARPTEGAYSALLTFDGRRVRVAHLWRLRAFRFGRIPGLDRRDGTGEDSPTRARRSRFAERRGGGRVQERPQLWRRGLSAAAAEQPRASAFRHRSS